MTRVAVEARDLWVRAAERTLVAGASFAARGGELVALVGASGSGKSTLLRALCGRLPGALTLESGLLRWSLDGAADPGPWLGRVLTHLPQEAGIALDPFRTVAAQLAAVGGGPEALAEVGFDASTARRVLGARPHELSQGMAERSAMAVALARRSPALLCDEPTTGLDAPSRAVVLGALRRRADAGSLVVVVTHDRPAVSRVADRVLAIDRGRPEAA